MVEFTLTFKNHLNQAIHKETAYPVYVSSFSTPANQPLGPSQQIQFAFKSPDCPPEWKPGHVDIEITKVLVQR